VRSDRIFSGIILALVILSFGLGSCYRAEDCSPTTRDYFVLQLADTTGKAVKDTLSVSTYSTDFTIMDTISSQFNLPLDPAHDTITYILQKPGFSNWIKVGYHNIVTIPGEECGPNFEYYSLRILGTSYDSVRLIDERLFNTIVTNIRVTYE